MDQNKIKEEMIEIDTVQIALDDKLHRVQSDIYKIHEIHNNIQKRIDIVKELFKEE